MSHVIRVVIAIAVLAATGSTRAQSNPEITLLAPLGTSIQTATAEQLASAVSKAIRSNPAAQAPAITAQAIGGLRGDEKAKAAAVTTSALKAGHGVDVVPIVKAASAANPSLAPTVAATTAGVFPKLAVPISGAAAEAAPTRAREIGECVAKCGPDYRDQIFEIIRCVSEDPEKDKKHKKCKKHEKCKKHKKCKKIKSPENCEFDDDDHDDGTRRW